MLFTLKRHAEGRRGAGPQARRRIADEKAALRSSACCSEPHNNVRSGEAPDTTELNAQTRKKRNNCVIAADASQQQQIGYAFLFRRPIYEPPTTRRSSAGV